MGRLSLPRLITPRLRLEPATDEHLALLVGLNSDPEVMRFLLGRAATPAETLEEWARRRGAQSDEARGLGYWIGFESGPEGGRFVGWWSASSFLDDPASSGLGYRLRRSAWGNGLATEGARAMMAQAFAAPHVRRVAASTMAVNAGSRRVLTKLGMRHTHSWVERWDDPLPGSEQGEVRYEISRDEWVG